MAGFFLLVYQRYEGKTNQYVLFSKCKVVLGNFLRQALMMKSAIGHLYWQNRSCNPEVQLGTTIVE
jgi:hypothetical protein